MTQSPDAGASPARGGHVGGMAPNPLLPNAAPPAGVPPGMRSIFERMTNPTPQDLQVGDRLRNLTRAEIDRIMSHLGTTLEHLAARRDDLTVTRSSDTKGWTIRVDMTPNVPDPTL